MLAKLLTPKVDAATLILRLGLAAIFMVHGWFKIDQDLPLLSQLTMTQNLLIGWMELICGTLLLVGLLSRLAVLPLIADMIGAIILVTGKHALEGPRIRATGADYTNVG